MRRLMRNAVLGLGVLAMPGIGQAQLWPLQTGPGGDMLGQSLADFDRLRRAAPAEPKPVALPARQGVAAPPAWIPPPLPPQRRIRRTAAPRSAPAVAAAPAAPAPVSAPATEPARKPDIETVERRLAERERILRDLQRDLVEERRLVEEWRGGQRAIR